MEKAAIEVKHATIKVKNAAIGMKLEVQKSIMQ